MRPNYEVVSGLTGEDTVALPGDADFRDGMAVKVVNLDMTNVPGGNGASINFICALLVCLTLAAAARAEETPPGEGQRRV